MGLDDNHTYNRYIYIGDFKNSHPLFKCEFL